jgi:hypothetical protein
VLSYSAGAGVANNVTISWDGAHTYTLTDTAETISASGLFAYLQCKGSGTNTLTVNSNSVPYLTVGPRGNIVTAYTPGVTGMNVDLGDQVNGFTLAGTGVPIVVNNTKSGTDSVVLGSLGASSSSTLANIHGAVSVSNPLGSTSLAIYDGGDGSYHDVSMYDGSITGLAPANIYWAPSSSATGGVTSLAVHGGSGYGNTFDVYNTSNFYGGTLLSPGTGTSELILVQATTGALDVNNTGWGTQVDVGDNGLSSHGTMANIKGFVDVYGSSPTILNLDDSGNTTGRTVLMYDGEVVGLAPANIYWTPASASPGGVIGLSVNGGSGGNTFYVENTSKFYNDWTELVTGTGNDVVNINATTGTLNVYNPGGLANVWLGRNDFTWNGTLANINGNVDVWGPGSTSLFLLDSNDPTGRTVSMYDGEVVGLAPANITWTPTASSSAGVNQLTMWGGPGGNTFNIYNTSIFAYGTSLDPGSGNNAVNIYATTGALSDQSHGQDRTDIGLGSLANINGYVAVSGVGTGATALLVDDSKDSTARTATLTSSTLTGLSPAPIVYTGGNTTGVTSLTVDGGSGGNTFYVQGTSAHVTTLNGGTGTNTLVGPNVADTWVLNAANGGSLLFGKVKFANFQHLVGGNGVDTFGLRTTGSALSIDGGGAPAGQGDWLDYSAFLSTNPVTVNLATGAATNVNGGAAGAVSRIQNVLGGSGNNNLTGNAQGNILIGGGTNTLVGGSGNSLLIGGSGGGTITGGSGQDILIAGTTSFNSSEVALMSLLQELQRTDRTFAQKVADLKNGGGYNGSYKLTWGTTVTQGARSYTLSGDASASAQPDWFFANLGPTGVFDTITDFNDDGVTDQLN